MFGCGSAAFAEYGCAREDALAPKPRRASFEEFAALSVAGVTALQALRKAKVQPGQKVLIDGASGGVGIFAVQIAKALGAEVTAVCSTKHVGDLRAVGADRVIDYTKDDFEKSRQKYDAIIGVNGDRSVLSYRRALSDKGTYVMAGSSRPLRALLTVLLLSPLLSRSGGKQMGFLGISKVNSDDLAVLSGFVEAGKVMPLVDRRYTLEETRDAFRYFAEGHVRGKVVLSIGSSSVD